MIRFIGTKIIEAAGMTLGEHYASTNHRMPVDFDGKPHEDLSQHGYQVRYADGYISWSPTKAFEDAYHRCDAMPFGLALEALKLGHRVAREGWNGKGMWLSLSGKAGSTNTIAAEQFWSPHNAWFAKEQGGFASVLPSITMKTADDKILMGWLASQTDMLAEDWVILDGVQS